MQQLLSWNIRPQLARFVSCKRKGMLRSAHGMFLLTDFENLSILVFDESFNEFNLNRTMAVELKGMSGEAT
ncbi:MAG: hypothetical protein KDA96_20500 [Planctomycetaceae bacterium]|nr:hypothetical protein [Planctomycetaceae bacterium]